MTIMGKRIVILNQKRFISAILVAFLLLWFLTYSASGFMQKEEPATYVTYTVKTGDTLWSIAGDHNPDGKDVREMVYIISTQNNIDDDGYIYPNQKLMIPSN